MTKKRTRQHLRKRKTKLTSWSTLFQVVRTSTSRNLQKKRREIKLMTKKRTPQHLRKRKTKLTGWSTLFQVVRTSTSKNLKKKKKINQVNGKKKKPQTTKKEKNKNKRLIYGMSYSKVQIK